MKFTKDDIKQALVLYVVTDRKWLKENEQLADVCKIIIENGATFIQLREKELDDTTFTEEAQKLQALCRQYGIPFVVNDRVEITVAIDADGVHVGQSDIKGRNIRAIIGDDKILGISAGTVAEAVAAEKAGADYIGVGAVFATNTKKDATPLSLEELRDITHAVSIPAVAIGGINESNLNELAGSGVAGVAVVSAIFAKENPGIATAALLKTVQKMVVKK